MDVSRIYKQHDSVVPPDLHRGKGQLVTKTGTTRSVFDLGSHRHNITTAVNFNTINPLSGSVRPAGIPKHGQDQINNLASVFLKQVAPASQKLASSLFMQRRHSKSQP